MKILIVAATQNEVKRLEKWLNSQLISNLNHTYFFLTTGIGIARATFFTTMALSKQRYDLVIQVGIAGSFQKFIKIGDVVWVKRDLFTELGADTQDGFLMLPQLLLENSLFEIAHSQNYIFPKPTNLTNVFGITSDTIHNRVARIEEIRENHNPDIETMEGAAIMFVCQQMGIPNIQVRSISNIVAPRTQNEWNIDLALDSLTKWGIHYIQLLEKEWS